METLSRKSIRDRLSPRTVLAAAATLLLIVSSTGCGGNTQHDKPPPEFHEETRVVDLIEGLASRKSAVALARRLGSGRRFERRAMRETVTRATTEEDKVAFNGHLVHAIFAAPLNKVAGPVSYAGRWVILVVRSTRKY